MDPLSYKKKIDDQDTSCSDLKNHLHNQIQGECSPDTFCPLLATTTVNAANADQNASGYYPDRMITKVYCLAEQLLEVLGNNWE